MRDWKEKVRIGLAIYVLVMLLAFSYGSKLINFSKESDKQVAVLGIMTAGEW